MRSPALSLGLMLLAAAGVSAGATAWRPTGLAAAPASARAAKNPYEGQADAVRAGRKLFMRHCAECHGADARGTTSAPGLVRAVQGAAPGEVFWFLTNGDRRAGMPSWARLPEPRRWQLVAFLTTLAARVEPPRLGMGALLKPNAAVVGTTGVRRVYSRPRHPSQHLPHDVAAGFLHDAQRRSRFGAP